MAARSHARQAALRPAEDAQRREALLSGLRKAATIWSAAERDAAGNPERAMRAAISLQLGAVLTFFRAVGVAATDVRPLFELHGAIADIQGGRKAPLLMPPKKAGRPPAAARQGLPLATVAAAITALIAGGMPEIDAAQKAARAIEEAGGVALLPGRGSAPRWKSLLAWRAELLAGRKNQHFREVYDRAFATLRSGDFEPLAYVGAAVEVFVKPSQKTV